MRGTHGKSGMRVVLLMTVIMLFAQPVYANLSNPKTALAIGYYSLWVKEKLNGSGADISGIPGFQTKGDLRAFGSLLKKHIGDKKTGKYMYGTGRPFSTERDAVRYYWSLCFVHNPYIEYTIVTEKIKGRYYGYVLDNKSNAVKYKHDQSGKCKRAAKAFTNKFLSELNEFQNTYGQLPLETKIACAANFIAQELVYRNGWVPYNGKKIYSGGDLYTAYVTHHGVCSDYSTLMQVLCRAMGIDCKVVMGFVSDGEKMGAHQWNLIQLNGKNYYVDPTFDDVGENTGVARQIGFAGSVSEMYAGYDVYLIG
jgi:transglutaminase-like putative cysteine protease